MVLIELILTQKLPDKKHGWEFLMRTNLLTKIFLGMVWKSLTESNFFKHTYRYYKKISVDLIAVSSKTTS